MITVTVERFVEKPNYQVFSHKVVLNVFDRLTPRTARLALEIAFGKSDSGRVWADDMSYGYQVYTKSARKIYPDLGR
jgi:hypothetical protein